MNTVPNYRLHPVANMLIGEGVTVEIGPKTTLREIARFYSEPVKSIVYRSDGTERLPDLVRVLDTARGGAPVTVHVAAGQLASDLMDWYVTDSEVMIVVAS